LATQQLVPEKTGASIPSEVLPKDFQDLAQRDPLIADGHSHQDIGPEIHPDIFDGGDRSIVLGSDAWVTLEDGRQIKTVYSADGTLLTIEGAPFEMWSKTNIGFSLRSRITVKEVLIRNGGQEMVITGKARGLSGETVFSRDGLRNFVQKLAEGHEPEFPVSTVASSGFIMKHEKPEDGTESDPP
jgi:hypothetical protein